jgi:hypothetical protein
MNGASIAAIMGVLIIVTGIALVGVQIQSGGDHLKEQNFKLISAQAGPINFNLETAFPGVPIIAMGMVLLVVSAILKH